MRRERRYLLGSSGVPPVNSGQRCPAITCTKSFRIKQLEPIYVSDNVAGIRETALWAQGSLVQIQSPRPLPPKSSQTHSVWRLILAPASAARLQPAQPAGTYILGIVGEIKANIIR
jgi:hypothetical protein